MGTSHSKIINSAARQELKPLGLKQKGASRVWLDDHGWWIVHVEFQPSAWSKGSHLNTGISWLLYEKAHLGFDVGYRIDTPSIEIETEAQFALAAQKIVGRAAEEVTKLRSDFSSLQSAVEHYRSEELAGEWTQYYAGVIYGLAGMTAESRELLENVAAGARKRDYQKGLAHRARDLLLILDNPKRFRQSVTGIVYRARSAANLDNREGRLSF